MRFSEAVLSVFLVVVAACASPSSTEISIVTSPDVRVVFMSGGDTRQTMYSDRHGMAASNLEIDHVVIVFSDRIVVIDGVEPGNEYVWLPEAPPRPSVEIEVAWPARERAGSYRISSECAGTSSELMTTTARTRVCSDGDVLVVAAFAEVNGEHRGFLRQVVVAPVDGSSVVLDGSYEKYQTVRVPDQSVGSSPHISGKAFLQGGGFYEDSHPSPESFYVKLPQSDGTLRTTISGSALVWDGIRFSTFVDQRSTPPDTGSLTSEDYPSPTYVDGAATFDPGAAMIKWNATGTAVAVLAELTATEIPLTLVTPWAGNGINLPPLPADLGVVTAMREHPVLVNAVGGYKVAANALGRRFDESRPSFAFTTSQFWPEAVD